MGHAHGFLGGTRPAAMARNDNKHTYEVEFYRGAIFVMTNPDVKPIGTDGKLIDSGWQTNGCEPIAGQSNIHLLQTNESHKLKFKC